MTTKKAVICDDDVTLTRIVQFVLVKQGFTVFTAANGNEGLALIQSEKPSFLILDLEMPEKDGLAVLEELQKQRDDKPYTIVLSVHESKEKHEQVIALGAQEVFIKPFNTAELVKKVESLIREGKV